MERNLAVLSSLNETYTREWNALKTIPESTALEARSLGYVAEDEVVVRLSVTTVEPTPPSPGERLTYEREVVIPEARIKKISLIIALATAALGLLLRFFPPNGITKRQRDILVQIASRT